MQTGSEEVVEVRRRLFVDHRGHIEQGRYATEDVRRCRVENWWLQAFLDRYDGDVDIALPALIECMKWRLEFRVHALTHNTLADSLEKRILFMHGYDNADIPLLWFCAKQHKKDQFNMETRRVLVYWLEKHYRACRAQQQLVILFDMSGTGLQHMDLDLIKFLLHCVKNYFPGILGYLLVYDIPWVLNAAWRVVKTWLDANAQKKIIFVNSSSIKQHINAANLPPHMGGTDDYQFSLTELQRSQSASSFNSATGVGSPLAFSEDLPDAQSMDSLPGFELGDSVGSYDVHFSASSASDNAVGEQSGKRRTVTFADENGGEPLTRTSDDVLSPWQSALSGRAPDRSVSGVPDSPRLGNRQSAMLSARYLSTEDDDSSPQRNPSSSPMAMTSVFQNPTGPQPVSLGPLSRTLGTSEASIASESIASTSSAKSKPVALSNGGSNAGMSISRALSLKAKDLCDQRITSVNSLQPGTSKAFVLLNPKDELSFNAYPGEQESVDVIAVRNLLDDKCLAFKVKTTSPEKFRVRPSAGFVQPDDTAVIKIYLQAGYHSTVHRDKFLVLAVPVNSGVDVSILDAAAYWRTIPKGSFVETRLRCKYIGEDGVPLASPRGPYSLGNGSLPSSNDAVLNAKRLSELQASIVRIQEEQRILRLGLCFVCALCLVLLFSVKWSSNG